MSLPRLPVAPTARDTYAVHAESSATGTRAQLDKYTFTCNQCDTINDTESANGDYCFNCGDSRFNPHPDTYEEPSNA